MSQRSIRSSSVRPLGRAGLVLAALLAALPLACVDAGVEGGASEMQQRQCKDSCDQLKFFDCNDADEHASCFVACEQADGSAIDVFVSCVRADICDPACVDDLLVDADLPEAGEGGGGGGGGGGGTPEGTDCTRACEDFVADGCMEPIDCAAACGSLPAGDRSFVVYCEARRDGCTLPSECAEVFDGGGEGGGEEGGAGPEPADLQAQCASGCDDMIFWQCLDAEQHADCRSECAGADDAAIGTFLGCLGIDPQWGGTGDCNDSACYDVFVGG